MISIVKRRVFSKKTIIHLCIVIFLGLSITQVNAFDFDNLNISTHACTSDSCTTNSGVEECRAALTFCNASIDLFQSTSINLTVKKFFYKTSGHGLIYLKKLLVKTPVFKNKDITAQLLNQVGKSFKKANKKVITKSKTSLYDWGIFALDIVVAVGSDFIIEGSNMSDTYKQVSKWAVKATYTDLKWGLGVATGTPKQKAMAQAEAVIGNLELLAEIFVADYNATIGLIDAQYEAALSEKYREIFDLVYLHKTTYHKLKTETDKSQKLTFFLSECFQIQLDGFVGFFGSISGNLVSGNNAIRNACQQHADDIKQSDKEKYDFFDNYLTLDSTQYEKLIRYKFPADEVDELLALYTLSDLDNKFLSKKRSALYKTYLKIYNYNKKFFSDSMVMSGMLHNNYITVGKAMRLIVKMRYGEGYGDQYQNYDDFINYILSNHSAISSYVKRADTYMTREDFIKILYIIYEDKGVKNALYKKWPKYSFQQIERVINIVFGDKSADYWPYEAKALFTLRALSGATKGDYDSLTNKYKFRFNGTNSLSYHNFITMLVNTHDLSYCGEVDCDGKDQYCYNCPTIIVSDF